MYLVFCLMFGVAFASGRDYAEKGNEHFSAVAYQAAKRAGYPGYRYSYYVISPILIEIVFAIYYLGSAGGTRENLGELFGFSLKNAEVEERFEYLVPLLSQNGFRMAHKMIALRGTEWQPTWQKKVEDIFHLQFEVFDDSDEPAEKIERWFQEHTNNKMERMIYELHQLQWAVTHLLLLSASYFQANWTDTSATKTVMARYFNYGPLHKKVGKFLELPFEKSEASMVFVYPETVSDFKILEDEIEYIFKGPHFNRSEPTTFSVPKFRFEYAIMEYSIHHLRKMGFGGGVDWTFLTKFYSFPFSNITDNNDRAWINAFTEKVYMDLNEKGVEIADGLIAQFEDTTYIYNNIVDLPFIFYIKLRQTIVFMGRKINFKIIDKEKSNNK
ncbi:leukocyte elastase inhibitor C isoform X2 [Tribolium castaneum]|uniref:Serpin peptidase inhibitor 8 n=1 Tax=Tribolium castaneum TaxID=7070 RepID=D6WWH9_TRICA|nr:PREDICTED: leukocyte elastase inhibitor C-like [Tribolium castaneum]EFA09178.1 serpin peptidase inhibitor 8 [Tribolium castaneum]|eukprot:XP_015838228.1 PREDICTED: leukocyte elastase inhibitor C-like [Tribolium castaneum]